MPRKTKIQILHSNHDINTKLIRINHKFIIIRNDGTNSELVTDLLTDQDYKQLGWTKDYEN